MEIAKCPYHEYRNDAAMVVVGYIDASVLYVECPHCGARGPGKSTEAEAVAAWNSVAGMRGTCTWKHNDITDYWHTGCDTLFEMPDEHANFSDIPGSDDYLHCPKCGKKIEVVT